MNKLEEKYLLLLDKEIDFDKPPILPYTNIDNIVQQSAEITTDVAIKFAEWLSRGFDIGYDNGRHFYMDGNGDELITQELFDIFINQYYEAI